MSTPTLEPRYKLIFTVPHSSLEACKSAVFAKGEEIPAYLLNLQRKVPSFTLYPPPPFFLLGDDSYTLFVAYIDPGAGSFLGGKYSMVCFETAGTAQFLPGEGAKPNIGALGKVERVPETKVEVLCVGRDVMTGAVESLKRAHPYEEVAYEVYTMENV